MALLGYAPATTEASYAAWEDRVAPEDLPRVKAAIQLSRNRHTDYACEYRVVWADVSLRWVEAFGRFYYDDRIVTIHQGTIQVDSTVGQGSIFTIDLPIYSGYVS
jgi:PAS fold